MLKVTKEELMQLKKYNLLTQHIVTNKSHRSSQKTHYVVEDRTILRFLGYYTQANCLQISNTQLQQLIKGNLIIPETIQHQGAYVPHANCFIAYTQEIYISKEYKLLSFLGLLKS